MSKVLIKDAHVETDGFCLYLKYNPAASRNELYIVRRIDGKKYVAKPIELEYVAISEGKPAEAPTLSTGWNDQDLLYALGCLFEEALIKEAPAASKIEGQYEAQSKHLEDMRTIAFKELRIEGKAAIEQGQGKSVDK